MRQPVSFNGGRPHTDFAINAVQFSCASRFETSSAGRLHRRHVRPLKPAGNCHSRPGTFTITLFANDSCDASGYGEGDEKIGTQTGVATSLATMTDNGTATFAIPVTSAKALDGRYITALATDQNHNTSEFSKCMPADRIFADGGEI